MGRKGGPRRRADHNSRGNSRDRVGPRGQAHFKDQADPNHRADFRDRVGSRDQVPVEGKVLEAALQEIREATWIDGFSKSNKNLTCLFK